MTPYDDLHVELSLTIEPDADPIAVADAVLDVLCQASDDQLPGVFSVDGADLMHLEGKP